MYQLHEIHVASSTQSTIFDIDVIDIRRRKT